MISASAPAAPSSSKDPAVSCTVHEACWTGRRTGRETVGGMFHRDGQYWTIAWRGRRCVVRDLRGLHYIAQVLRHPGREFHALDLIGSIGAGLRRDGVAALDAPAKRPTTGGSTTSETTSRRPSAPPTQAGPRWLVPGGK